MTQQLVCGMGSRSTAQEPLPPAGLIFSIVVNMYSIQREKSTCIVYSTTEDVIGQELRCCLLCCCCLVAKRRALRNPAVELPAHARVMSPTLSKRAL